MDGRFILWCDWCGEEDGTSAACPRGPHFCCSECARRDARHRVRHSDTSSDHADRMVERRQMGSLA